jgi:hypothetical protein
VIEQIGPLDELLDLWRDIDWSSKAHWRAEGDALSMPRPPHKGIGCV